MARKAESVEVFFLVEIAPVTTSAPFGGIYFYLKLAKGPTNQNEAAGWWELQLLHLYRIGQYFTISISTKSFLPLFSYRCSQVAN